MGNTSYNFTSRSLRADTIGYASNTIAENFTQSKVRRVHDSMNSKKISLRECRDSETHPNTVPIVLQLDVTGSMGDIPQHLVIEGLPKLMSNLIQKGVADASLLFTAVGDHECDSYPLQIGQFESGDAELDMWLTRTYLEGGGGGNAGESYPLGWYFASKHIATDAWDKRHKKGFYISVGDEPFLTSFPSSALKEILPTQEQKSYTAKELYDLASEKWDIYHIHINHNGRTGNGWKELLGQHFITVNDYRQVPETIAKLILDNNGNIPNNLSNINSSPSIEAPSMDKQPSML